MKKDPIFKLIEGMLNEEYEFKNRKSLREALNKEFAVSYRSIPEIKISELGWGSIDTPQEGQETSITESDRYILESYLKNIKGNTFEEKMSYINKLYEMKPDELEESDMIRSDNTSEKIQKAVSYLVFLKVMTSLLTDYNAASAAFAFESFLATLLGGEQIKVGSGTIADIKTVDNKPISLKLLSAGKPEILGSFSDLVNDLVEDKFAPHHGMTYVVGLKEVSGKGRDLTGVINFTEFTITLENVMDIMKNQLECIALPRQFMQDETYDISDIKKKDVSDEKMQELFSKALRDMNNFKDINVLQRTTGTAKDHQKVFEDTLGDFDQDSLDKVATEIEKFLTAYENNVIFAKGKGGSERETPIKLGYVPFRSEFIRNTFKHLVDNNLLPADFNYTEEFEGDAGMTRDGMRKKGIFKVVRPYAPSAAAAKKINLLENMFKQYMEKASKAAENYRSSIRSPQQYLKTIQAMDFTVENVVQFYKSLPTERKKIALKNCKGYLSPQEWKLNGYNAIKAVPESNFKPIGRIIVGQTNVQNLVDKLINVVDLSVFEIFDNLKVMSMLINDYFANGMKEDAKAASIQTAAKNIDKKTKQIRLKNKQES